MFGKTTSQVGRVPGKGSQAHLSLDGNGLQLFVLKDGPTFSNQNRHRHKELHREGVGTHFDQAITVGAMSFKS